MDERDKYIANLEAKITRAAKARRFNDSEDGALVRELIIEQLNQLTKVALGKTNFDKPTEHAYVVGKIHGLKSLLTIIDIDAQQDTDKLQEDINLARSDG